MAVVAVVAVLVLLAPGAVTGGALWIARTGTPAPPPARDQATAAANGTVNPGAPDSIRCGTRGCALTLAPYSAALVTLGLLIFCESCSVACKVLN